MGGDGDDNTEVDAGTDANTAKNTNDRDQDAPSRAWTIFDDDTPARKAAKESADEHVHNYVQDQLKRLMSPDAPTQYQDEIEATYDGM